MNNQELNNMPLSWEDFAGAIPTTIPGLYAVRSHGEILVCRHGGVWYRPRGNEAESATKALADADAEARTRIGNTPAPATDEDWPVCRVCGSNLTDDDELDQPDEETGICDSCIKEAIRHLERIKAQHRQSDCGEHDPAKCGCEYKGNDSWSCGHIDNTVDAPDETPAPPAPAKPQSAIQTGTEMHTQMQQYIDITPVGCQTPEGAKRVQQAQQEWDSATHELANYLKSVVEEIFDRDTNKIARAEYYSELQTLIGIRESKQEEFLRSCTTPRSTARPPKSPSRRTNNQPLPQQVR